MLVQKSVAIIGGFAEGKWHSKILRTELERAGFVIEANIAQADIVIAHSAGCFFIPSSKKKQQIILIGPPYWPGKPLGLRMIQKIWRDFSARIKEQKLGYWLLKTFWSILYTFGDLVRAIKIRRSARLDNFYEVFEEDSVTLIRNNNDAWCTPNIKKLLGDRRFKYVEMPREHDDCWINPKPYVALLSSLEY